MFVYFETTQISDSTHCLVQNRHFFNILGLNIVNIFAGKILTHLKKIIIICLNNFKLMMLLDQFMCIKCTKWRKSIFNRKMAFLSSMMVILFFFCLNFHINFTVNYSASENGTFIDKFIVPKVMVVWLNVSFKKNSQFEIV